jgi:SAM-dependent methyltransferase
VDSLDKTFINALFNKDYYSGLAAIELYMAKIALGILNDAGVSGYLTEDFRTVEETKETFQFHAQSEALLSWVLRYLALKGFAQSRNSAYKLNSRVPDLDTGDDERQILGFTPSADIFIQLVQRIRADMGNFLSGRKKGGDILFADKTLSLWYDFFNNKFYGYSVLNYGVAYGIAKWFSGTRGKSMLELGSGTSGATVKAFQALRDNNLLESMDSITLTDIVPALLNLGKKNIDTNINPSPEYKQEILDINKPFADQGFAGYHFDIIYGVNVMHVARDLEFTLRETYSYLNENGILVLAETIRPAENRPMHHEIIFNLLNNYYDVEIDNETRPCHGFLTKELSIKNLEMTGFKNIEYITELEQNDQFDFDVSPLYSFLVLKGQK